ncbi:uncharacterized protein EDB91DRAFT_1340659 [Suillus paluster]|uniref:uncharacterized protein n=1 Tax=Suillus paluster TaxID=48578 RepID=UPI001B87C437|nr:uncharacterized protein EDB91DRAFT_1340659 [Suillus paluster]KAG1720501.1 hypothetical protein EDB91DRAFT_1340659 [Suillus paluster]
MFTPPHNIQDASSQSNPAAVDIPSSTSMSTPGQNMLSPSSPSSPAPVDIDFPATDDGIKPHAASKELAVAVSIAGGLGKNMSDTLEQILDVLRGSTIAEELSNEYDNFLERANDDLGITLTFITANGPNSVPDISNLSSSMGYSSSTVWIQTLAYASLAFSVFPAFGAVMGKQWLNSYKAARGRGTLEGRGMQRQMKPDGIQYFHLQTVLRAFLVLLQISLLLFGLSLSANMWTQQTTISNIIVSSTAFGILSYTGTVFVSVWHPATGVGASRGLLQNIPSTWLNDS